MSISINTTEHKEQLVFNSMGDHVGTIHTENGVETIRSWIIDGVWQHGASDNAPIPSGHTISYMD